MISSFFLWKDASEMADVFRNEIDTEKVGDDCTGYSSKSNLTVVGGKAVPIWPEPARTVVRGWNVMSNPPRGDAPGAL